MRVSFESVTASMSPMPVRQVQLALLLARSGARFIVVGSTALHLHDVAARLPQDLDLAVARSDVPLLTSLLERVTTVAHTLRPTGASPQRVMTSWTPVDVFLADVLPAWHTIEIDGTELRVADE